MGGKILTLTEIDSKARSRFFDKIRKTDGCWLWKAGKDKDGYGVFSLQVNNKKTMYYAHRVSYFIHHKELPQLPLDHLCKRRSCVRPEHLEAVTVTENNRRSDCPSGLSFRKKNCKEGHPLVPTTHDPANKRYCPICAKAKRHKQHMIDYYQKGGRERRHQRWLESKP